MEYNFEKNKFYKIHRTALKGIFDRTIKEIFVGLELVIPKL